MSTSAPVSQRQFQGVLFRSQNADGQFRRIRSDAHIGNVRSLAGEQDLVDKLGPRTTVGVLRSIFGGLDVSQIAAMPRVQRAPFVEHYLQRVGLLNQAAKAALTAALWGRLGQRVVDSDSYYVHINGQKLDRDIVKAFIRAVESKHDDVVSNDEAKDIVKQMEDGRGLTSTEMNTYLFCLQHFPITDKAVRETLVPALRRMTGAPVLQLKDGQQGFEFMALTDHLEATGRLADLYSAKADMTSEEMMAMWDNGLSLEQLNQHLKNGLAPRSRDEIVAKFGAQDVAEVESYLASRGDQQTIAKLRAGQLSYGAFQNLVYGSWQMANTPYDPTYQGDFRPIPMPVATAAD